MWFRDCQQFILEEGPARKQTRQQSIFAIQSQAASVQCAKKTTAPCHKRRSRGNVPLVFRRQGESDVRLACSHESELVSHRTHRLNLVCRLLLEKKKIETLLSATFA